MDWEGGFKRECKWDIRWRENWKVKEGERGICGK
jgi:hypothetical protein